MNSENDTNNAKRKMLMIGLPVVGVLVILTVVLMTALMPHNSANLVISVAPADATVTIGQKDYKNGIVRDLAPGHYTATVSKEGFETKMVELDLENDGITYLREYLAQSEDGFDYYEADLESLLYLREYASTHDDKTVKEFLEDYDKRLSIRDELPIVFKEETTGDYYEVYYRDDEPDCEWNYCLEIKTSSDAYEDLALSVLRIRGYNPDDYMIIHNSDRCDSGVRAVWVVE